MFRSMSQSSTQILRVISIAVVLVSIYNHYSSCGLVTVEQVPSSVRSAWSWDVQIDVPIEYSNSQSNLYRCCPHQNLQSLFELRSGHRRTSPIVCTIELERSAMQTSDFLIDHFIFEQKRFSLSVLIEDSITVHKDTKRLISKSIHEIKFRKRRRHYTIIN